MKLSLGRKGPKLIKNCTSRICVNFLMNLETFLFRLILFFIIIISKQQSQKKRCNFEALTAYKRDRSSKTWVFSQILHYDTRRKSEYFSFYFKSIFFFMQNEDCSFEAKERNRQGKTNRPSFIFCLKKIQQNHLEEKYEMNFGAFFRNILE